MCRKLKYDRNNSSHCYLISHFHFIIINSLLRWVKANNKTWNWFQNDNTIFFNKNKSLLFCACTYLASKINQQKKSAQQDIVILKSLILTNARDIFLFRIQLLKLYTYTIQYSAGYAWIFVSAQCGSFCVYYESGLKLNFRERIALLFICSFI